MTTSNSARLLSALPARALVTMLSAALVLGACGGPLDEGSLDRDGEAASADLNTNVTVSSWPSVFPLVAGGVATNATVSLSNGKSISFKVHVTDSGEVMVTNFQYNSQAASTSSHNFTPAPLASPPAQSNQFVASGVYDITMTISWSGTTASIALDGPLGSGDLLSNPSDLLCNGITLITM